MRDILGSEPFRLALDDLLSASSAALAEELGRLVSAGAGQAGAGTPLAKLIPMLNKVAIATLQGTALAVPVLATPSLDELCWMVHHSGAAE